MWAGSPRESLPDFFRQSVVLTNSARPRKFCYSARTVVADTIGITMTGGRNAGLCVLLQDKGQGKTTDRLALTFLFARSVIPAQAVIQRSSATRSASRLTIF
jgi:hypothetical protein